MVLVDSRDGHPGPISQRPPAWKYFTMADPRQVHADYLELVRPRPRDTAYFIMLRQEINDLEADVQVEIRAWPNAVRPRPMSCF